jgi:hypothetical protein
MSILHIHDVIRAAIDRRRFGDPMKAGLRLLLEGHSYRHAAELAGVDYRELHRNAKTVKELREAHLRAWRDSWGRAFPSMWRRHLAPLDKAA